MTAENRPATREALPCGCPPPPDAEYLVEIERSASDPTPLPGAAGWYRRVAEVTEGDTTTTDLERLRTCPSCGAAIR